VTICNTGKQNIWRFVCSQALPAHPFDKGWMEVRKNTEVQKASDRKWYASGKKQTMENEQ
jgi:hypothetical protein